MQKTKHILIAAVLILALLAPSFAAPSAFAQPLGPDKPKTPAWVKSDEPVSPDNAAPTRAEAVASDTPVRVIIKLSAPPLVKYQGGINGLAPAGMNAKNTKIDVHSPAAQAYMDYLARQQSEFAVQLAKVVPSAQIEYNYRITYNGVAVSLPGSSIPTVEKMVGKRNLSMIARHYPTMDASIPAIGLYDGFFNGTNPGVDMGLWKQLGGHTKAGAGLKVAMLDTGIDQTHEFFDPTGYAYPDDNPNIVYPRGETAYTTEKVIVARVYVRPGDPADPLYDCACPQDYIGHGTHTSGTVAGNFNTTSSWLATPLSGVAPRAWLMNYKIFYTNFRDGGDYSETPEELAALEDAVADDADVISNSWGGGDIDYHSADIEAFSAAVDAGIVVVFSAGNEGPSANSLGAPGVGEKFITVGASTTNRIFAYPLEATTSVPLPPYNTNAIPSYGPPVTTTLSAPFTNSVTAGNPLGCTGGSYLPGALNGKIVLIMRGTCSFSEKVNNAAAAGAVGVIVWNNVPGPAFRMYTPDTTIPSMMVTMLDATQNLILYSTLPDAAMQISTLERLTNANWADQVADFSSRGPNPVNLIKPDLVAPGVNILSSVPYGDGYDLYDGTSMAAPHVSGVAALVKQAHPDWTPQMIKSAIVNTTKVPASLDTSCTQYDLAGNQVPYPGPMCRGSGRLWAGDFGAGDPGVLLNPVSISLGAVYAPVGVPTVIQVPVEATSVLTYTVNGTVSLTPGVTDPHFSVTPSAFSVNLAGGASTVVTATFTIAPGIPVTDTINGSDYWGQINITFGQSGYYNLHIPYWVRVMPYTELGTANVLLIDDDASSCSLSWCGDTFTNYSSYYTETLNAMNVSYDLLELDYSGGPYTCAAPWDVARNYDKVIWFTGDSDGYLYWCDFGISSPNLSGLNRLMSSGAKVLATGQNFGYGISDYNSDNRNEDLMLYFGASYIQDDVFWDTTVPAPSAEAVSESNPFLDNVKIDFSNSATGGAHNQGSVDELNAVFFEDADAVPLFRAALQSDNNSQELVGTRVSSEPTIERVKNDPRTLWTTLGYRSILLSFGLEGVSFNNALAPNYGTLTDRGDLMQRLLTWLDDEVTIERFEVMASEDINVNDLVMAGSIASSSEGCKVNSPSYGGCGIVYYRWDWGDGSTPDYTYCNNALASAINSPTGGYQGCELNIHGYARPGAYFVRVEAMDMYGHKAVSEPLAVYVDTHFNFLPAVSSGQP